MVSIHSYRPNALILSHPTNPTPNSNPLCFTTSLFHHLPHGMNSNSNTNPNPFPWGIGWRAFFLGCSLGDRNKFEHTMEVCSNFSGIDAMHKEYDAVMKRRLHRTI